MVYTPTALGECLTFVRLVSERHTLFDCVVEQTAFDILWDVV